MAYKTLENIFSASIICILFAVFGCSSQQSEGDFKAPPKEPGRASYFDNDYLVVNCEQDIPQFTLSSKDSMPDSSTTKSLCLCVADEASLKSGKISWLKLPRALNVCVNRFGL